MYNDYNLTPVKLNGHSGKSVDHDLLQKLEAIGEEHVATSAETPLTPLLTKYSDEEKIDIIESHFAEIMKTLGLDLQDESLSGTPKRVAKMFVLEAFRGLNPANKPYAKSFDNSFGYKEMLVEKNIRVQSYCEHHFVPIIGKAHVAYISSGRVVGLSKLNRIVDYFSRRPQVQERLTVQIANELKKALNTDDIAVLIEAAHMCVSTRGIRDEASTTVTSHFSGKFKNESTRNEFMNLIKMKIKVV